MSWWDWFRPKPPKPKPPTKPSRTIDFNVEPWVSVATLTPTAADGSTPYGTVTAATLAGSEWHRTFTLGPEIPVWGATFTVAAEGWQTQTSWVVLPETNIQWPTVFLAPVAPPGPARATVEQFYDIKASFCNLRDAQDRVMFSPFIASLSDNDRQDWYQRWRDDGCTHIVLSPTCAYPGSPIPSFDWYGDPERFAALVREVLATPSASGAGFVPILLLDGGGPNIADRINAFWLGIRNAIGSDVTDVMVCPGWELVTAGEVYSAEYSYALETLHAHGWPHIWAHLSQGRAACSSNPIEQNPRDPWQGDEAGCWKSHGGQYVEGLFFQADATRPDDDQLPLPTPGDTTAQGWLDRWNDVVPRMGNGMNGWRVMRLCFFESQAYYYYRGQSDSAFCKRLAAKAKALADSYGVTVGMANGLP